MTKKSNSRKLNDRPLNIIYADDDPMDQLFFTQTLDKLQLPYTCQTVSNCNDLFDRLDSAEHRFDLIFLDINMPVETGHHCLKMIKTHKKHRHIPVIIFSGLHSKHHIDESYNLGAHYHVLKPHAPLNYVATLRKVFLHDWKQKQPKPDKDDFVINYTFS